MKIPPVSSQSDLMTLSPDVSVESNKEKVAGVALSVIAAQEVPAVLVDNGSFLGAVEKQEPDLKRKKVRVRAAKIDRKVLADPSQISHQLKMAQAQIDKTKINEFDCEGETLLTRSVSLGDVESVKLLREWGAPFDQLNKSGFSPLGLAIGDENLVMVELLVKSGAPIDQRDGLGFAPVVSAAIRRNQKMLELLKQLGANLNQSNRNGSTPLTISILSRDFEMVDFLVKLGADVNQADDRRYTPLFCALDLDDPKMIRLLKKLGVNLDQIRKEDGSTFLTSAVQSGKKKLIELLVQSGADSNKCDDNGWTPLALAWANKSDTISNLLVRLGANVQASEECLCQKMIAASWGLDGSTPYRGGSQTLRGGPPQFGLLLMKESLTAFFNDKTYHLPQEILDNKQLILEAFEQAFPLTSLTSAQIVERVKSGKPVILSSGFYKHVVTFLLYKGKVAVCNRGAERERDQAITFYRLPEPVTEEFVGRLTKDYVDAAAYHKMIEGLGEKIEGLGIQQKDQKSGNCYYASPKSALYALAHLIDSKSDKAFYKQFTAFARIYFFKAYLSKMALINCINQDLMEKVSQKFFSKIAKGALQYCLPFLAEIKREVESIISQAMPSPPIPSVMPPLEMPPREVPPLAMPASEPKPLFRRPIEPHSVLGVKKVVSKDPSVRSPKRRKKR